MHHYNKLYTLTSIYMQADTIVLTTGGFDPVHVGHISLFQEAGKLGRLIVGLNSDEWLSRKRGRSFMNWEERKKILLEMKSISEVMAFNDNDIHGSAKDAIYKVYNYYTGSGNKIIFAKGGDRTKDNIPETEICKELGIEIIYGIGGYDKPQSSSWLLNNWVKFCNDTNIKGKNKTFESNNYNSKE